MDVGCERLLTDMAAINNFGGLKYSGNLVITGYISNALCPRQTIGGSCGTMKKGESRIWQMPACGQRSDDNLTRTIC
jgi:hypothetical protein